MLKRLISRQKHTAWNGFVTCRILGGMSCVLIAIMVFLYLSNMTNTFVMDWLVLVYIGIAAYAGVHCANLLMKWIAQIDGTQARDNLGHGGIMLAVLNAESALELIKPSSQYTTAVAGPLKRRDDIAGRMELLVRYYSRYCLRFGCQPYSRRTQCHTIGWLIVALFGLVQLVFLGLSNASLDWNLDILDPVYVFIHRYEFFVYLSMLCLPFSLIWLGLIRTARSSSIRLAIIDLLTG